MYIWFESCVTVTVMMNLPFLRMIWRNCITRHKLCSINHSVTEHTELSVYVIDVTMSFHLPFSWRTHQPMRKLQPYASAFFLREMYFKLGHFISTTLFLSIRAESTETSSAPPKHTLSSCVQMTQTKILVILCILFRQYYLQNTPSV